MAVHLLEAPRVIHVTMQTFIFCGLYCVCIYLHWVVQGLVLFWAALNQITAQKERMD